MNLKSISSFLSYSSLLYDNYDSYHDRLTKIFQFCFNSDGAHEAMLAEGQVPQIVSKESKKQDEYEALQSFLRSISSTATLPPYVKGETYSSTKGVFNQVRTLR